MIGVNRWHGKIAALDAWTMTFIALFETSSSVPGTFFRIDLIETPIHRNIPTDVIEDEKLNFLAKITYFGNTCFSQIFFSTFGHPTRVTHIRLPGAGVEDVTT